MKLKESSVIRIGDAVDSSADVADAFSYVDPSGPCPAIHE